MRQFKKTLSNPYIQSVAFIITAIVFMIVIRPEFNNTLWEISAMSYMGFIGVNSAFVLLKKDKKKFIINSFIASLSYIVLSAILITLFAIGFKVKGENESSVAFLIFIYHPMLLTCLLFAQWIWMTFYRRK